MLWLLCAPSRGSRDLVALKGMRGGGAASGRNVWGTAPQGIAWSHDPGEGWPPLVNMGRAAGSANPAGAEGQWRVAGRWRNRRTQRTTPTPGNEGTVAPSQDNEKPDAVGGDGENRSAEPKGQPATVEDVMQRIRALDALPTVVVRDLGGIGAQIPTTGPSTSSTGPGPK